MSWTSRLGSGMRRLAGRVTPGHHSQGAVFVLLLVTALLLRRPLMLVAMVPFLVMHVCYGGESGWQRPTFQGRATGLLDVVIVTLGLFGLASYVALGLVTVLRTLTRLFT